MILRGISSPVQGGDAANKDYVDKSHNNAIYAYDKIHSDYFVKTCSYAGVGFIPISIGNGGASFVIVKGVDKDVTVPKSAFMSENFKTSVDYLVTGDISVHPQNDKIIVKGKGVILKLFSL